MDEQALKDLTVLTGLREEDLQLLRETAPVTSEWADDIAKAFYDVLFSYEPTAKVFRPDERPMREKTLRAWYLDVVHARVSAQFWRTQWYVGLVHIARHVPNTYMLGMMSRVQQLFLYRCLRAFDVEKAERVFIAFKRLTDVIAGLIAEGYFQNYIQAMERVAGIRPSLVERMMEMEIKRMLDEIKAQISATS
ncbi:MAG: hypothetical protein GXO54_02535 [Chloroflexi bacterium]|nr:hypothetical protein [Chloroflexota bacterium]